MTIICLKVTDIEGKVNTKEYGFSRNRIAYERADVLSRNIFIREVIVGIKEVNIK